MRHQLSEADDGKAVSARVGDLVEIGLNEMPSGGYRWLVEDPPDTLLSQPAEDFSFDEGTVGGINAARFVFRVEAPGRGTLRFGYKRPWETDEPPLKTWQVTVKAE